MGPSSAHPQVQHATRVLLITMLTLTGCATSTTDRPASWDRYDIARLRAGTGARASSSATDWATSNADSRRIAPGETLVLADLRGPGVIRHIWNTLRSREFGAARLLTLRIYWDDETEPSIACPLGDFFAVGHGMNVNVNSEPVRVTAEGRARNCYWPMPFRQSARITLTNDGHQPTEAFYFYIDWTRLPSLPPNTPYFHAQYRQEHPCNAAGRYVVADIRGRGHYVGTVLNCRQHERGWMGEGDDFFFIDGEPEPSLRGTGTEDYFCDAWGFRESSGPYYGVPVYEGVEIGDRTSVYRWHLPDPIPFSRSLRLELEHWGWWWIQDKDGNETITAGDRLDDWSTVAYWYQTEPHVPYAPLPPGPDRRYHDWTGVIEAEDLLADMNPSVGNVGNWGGPVSGELFVHWEVPEPGARLAIPLDVDTPGDYRIVLALQRRAHFGIVQFELDGVAAGHVLDLYHPNGASRICVLPPRALAAGPHTLAINVLSKHRHSTGYSVGIDAILLEPATCDDAGNKPQAQEETP